MSAAKRNRIPAMGWWGAAISLFYALAVILPLAPGCEPQFGESPRIDLLGGYWLTWVWIALPVAGQALLLYLSVDSSWRRGRRRWHVAALATLAGFLVAVLFCAAVASVLVVLRSESIWRASVADLLVVLGAYWLLWGALFYLHSGGARDPVSAALGWLLRGSVLELLIAVPSHIVIYWRHECRDPMVTSFGVVTGLAVMLLCSSPGVLPLYRKRMDSYHARRTAA